MSQTTDNPFWQAMWREDQIEFHQDSVNPQLKAFWCQLALPRQARVLVPLCGKSLDMVWLAQQGHEIVGIELSAIAVKAFFDENGLKPIKKRIGNFVAWRHGRITILCGDFFALKKNSLGQIDAVYDRAALTALPEAARTGYVARLVDIMSLPAQMLLLTLEDVAPDVGKHSLGEVDEEVAALYNPYFDIAIAHGEMCVDDLADGRDGVATAKVYHMTPHQGKIDGAP